MITSTPAPPSTPHPPPPRTPRRPPPAPPPCQCRIHPSSRRCQHSSSSSFDTRHEYVDPTPPPPWHATRISRRRRRWKTWASWTETMGLAVVVVVMMLVGAVGVVGAGGEREVGNVVVGRIQGIDGIDWGAGGDPDSPEVGWAERGLEGTDYTPILTSRELFGLAMDDTARYALAESTDRLDRREPSLSLLPRQSSKWPPDSETAVLTQRNGIVRPQNILWGWEFVHHMSVSELLLDPDTSPAKKEKRQDAAQKAGGNAAPTLSKPKLVRLTFNTCQQPNANMSDVAEGAIPPVPPQLEVYVSNTTLNKSPGPGVQGKAQMRVKIDRGWGHLEFEASSDIFIGVSAPSLPDSDALTTWQRNLPWNYELAVTTGEPYHGYIQDQFLYLVDTDDTAALLITGNMTSESALYGGVNETLTEDKLMKTTKYPYTMYAQVLDDTHPLPFSGIEKSYCAVRQLAQSKPGNSDISMTTRGLGNYPKQQFHLKELNRTSEYYGFLARPRDPNNPSDTGGTLWQPMGFSTKTDGNCRIIYNLPFCAEVAYAVPANPTVFSDTKDLMEFYDNIAEKWWKNFTYSLQQVQCNASSGAAYSPIRNCDHCAASYKNWLCAVTIPRCMDYSSTLPYLAARSEDRLFWNSTAPGWQKGPYMPVVEKDKNARNGTGPRNRNSEVDEVVMPGRYKEVKPCKDLCWSLVQDCPSSMGFGCPEMGSAGGRESYGERDPTGDVTCSYLGAVYFLSTAHKDVVWMEWFVALITIVALWGLM